MNGLIIATDGFEDSEFSYPFYRLREAGVDVDVATPEGESISGKHDYEFEADYALHEYEPAEWAEQYDLLVIPGGRSPEYLRQEAPIAAEIVWAFDEADQPVASICHGAQLLISADILEGRTITGYWTLEVDIENAGAEFVDKEVVVDGNLVTSRVPDDLPAFMGTLFEEFDLFEEPVSPAA